MKRLLKPDSELARVLLTFRKILLPLGAFSAVINVLMLLPAIYMLQNL